MPSLNTQSPFERWDGDCALWLATLNRFGSTFGYTHRRASWTVAATGGHPPYVGAHARSWEGALHEPVIFLACKLPLPWLGMSNLVADLRYCLRLLSRSPGFTLFVVLTLGIGIGANTTIFTAVNAILIRPLAINVTTG